MQRGRKGVHELCVGWVRWVLGPVPAPRAPVCVGSMDMQRTDLCMTRRVVDYHMSYRRRHALLKREIESIDHWDIIVEYCTKFKIEITA